MCGICGFVSPGGRISEEILVKMNASIVRRGPDGEGRYFDGTAGLAMRRLAIIDIAGGGQPIFNEDRSVCVVFNGEIYNYRELRRDLQARGHRFTTESDTEVLVHLYEEHGISLASHLDGMFAFALWDLLRRRLVLGRDRLGIKPLYIARVSQGVLFGSEIKSLRTTGLVSDAMDWQALDEYLTYTNVPCPRTIYEDIRQVLPGTTVTIDADGHEETRRYWSVPAVPSEPRPAADWIESCEKALKAAIETHLVSDVPVGAFLSGGIDSGLLVALMAQVYGRRVQTFTVGFQDAGASFLDERKYARLLAQRYPLDHHEIEVTPCLEDVVHEIVEAFDQPFADDSVLPSYYVCKAAARHVKVAMTGLGGDELFAGYRRHFGLILGDRYVRLPALLRERVIDSLVRSLPESRHSSDFIDHLKRFSRSGGAPAERRYQDSLATLPWSERRTLYTPDVAARISPQQSESVMLNPFQRAGGETSLERALRTDLQTYLVDDILTLTDRLSMWHSLELRVPYLDHHFVELAIRVPANLKIRGWQQKYLLKKIAERWLPREMIYHKKQGFEAPMGRWLRGPLLPFFDSIVNRSTVERAGYFDFTTIERLRNDHASGRRKNSKILFALLMFHLWQQRTACPAAA